MKLVLWAFVLVFGASALSLAGAPAQAGPILLISEGKLVGARDVDVLGTLYDVEFLDGTCISLFSGCDSSSDFAFNSYGAYYAGLALNNQVFLDSALGMFDTEYGLTRGCNANSSQVCFVQIPYSLGTRVNTVAVFNYNDSRDGVSGSGIGASMSTGGVNNETWARFLADGTLDPIQVPEPATLLLFGAGLLGLAGVSRRRRRVSPNA